MGKTKTHTQESDEVHPTTGGKSVARKSLPFDTIVKIHTDKILTAQSLKHKKTAAQRKRATERAIKKAVLNSTANVFPKDPFSRVVHRILRERAGEINSDVEPKLQAKALEIIQNAAEEYLVKFYEALEIIARNQGHSTVLTKHYECFKELRRTMRT